MDRIVKNHLGGDFLPHFQLVSIPPANRYNFGKYVLSINNYSSSHEVSLQSGKKLLAHLHIVLQAGRECFTLIYRDKSNTKISITSGKGSSMIIKNPPHPGYEINVCRNAENETVYVYKRDYVRKRSMFVIYDYLKYIGRIMDHVPFTLTSKLVDVLVTDIAPVNFEKYFNRLFFNGILAYTGDSGKINLVVFLSNGDIIPYRKIYSGDPNINENVYLREEIEKLRKNPLDHDIFW